MKILGLILLTPIIYGIIFRFLLLTSKDKDLCRTWTIALILAFWGIMFLTGVI